MDAKNLVINALGFSEGGSELFLLAFQPWSWPLVKGHLITYRAGIALVYNIINDFCLKKMFKG